MAGLTEAEKFRYEKRDAIEKIVKKQKISRQEFYETDKLYYDSVIRKMYYSYCDYQKYPEIQLSYMWVRLRDGLNRTEAVHTDWCHWGKYIDHIDSMVPEHEVLELYYLVVDGGWIYEGTLGAIKKVLYEYPAYMDDFYLFPRNYDWLVVHCEDGACMFRVWKLSEQFNDIFG